MVRIPTNEGVAHADVTSDDRPVMLAGAEQKRDPLPLLLGGLREQVSKGLSMIVPDRGRGVDTPVSTVSCPVASFLGRQARRRGRRAFAPSTQRGES
jgi:hypothetical protein